jgi:predicted MPP superfamily phosphohydrolase
MKYIIILLLILIVVYGFWIEPNMVKISNIEIASSKFDETINKFTIVQISDLHIKECGIKEQFVVKSLLTIKPNLVVFTGDFIDNKNDLNTLNDFLKAFRASYEGDSFAVLGNWDYNTEPDEVIKLLDNYDIKVLKNENIYYEYGNNKFYIIGVDDPITGHDDLDAALFRVNQDLFNLLIVHAPYIVNKFQNGSKFDLILTGHTHGGQIGIPFIARKLAPTSTDYIRGLYNTEFGTMYVNRGVGTTIIPLRLFCPPELTVIKLKKQH